VLETNSRGVPVKAIALTVSIGIASPRRDLAGVGVLVAGELVRRGRAVPLPVVLVLALWRTRRQLAPRRAPGRVLPHA
jgi:hypothetical protein